MGELVTGGCKCGLVRYQGVRIDAPMFRCHCRDCQQLTGGGHSEMIPLDITTFAIGDACRIFEMAGGSGQPTFSGFCPGCGCPLTRRSTRMSDRIYVHAGSLDAPGSYSPEQSIYASDAQAWDRCSVIKDR